MKYRVLFLFGLLLTACEYPEDLPKAFVINPDAQGSLLNTNEYPEMHFEVRDQQSKTVLGSEVWRYVGDVESHYSNKVYAAYSIDRAYTQDSSSREIYLSDSAGYLAYAYPIPGFYELHILQPGAEKVQPANLYKTSRQQLSNKYLLRLRSYDGRDPIEAKDSAYNCYRVGLDSLMQVGHPFPLEELQEDYYFFPGLGLLKMEIQRSRTDSSSNKVLYKIEKIRQF